MSAGVLTLIGDSVLDNGTYVAYTGLPGSHSVTDWLRKKLEPKGWVVHLKAIDGDVIAGMPAQIETVPKDTTHVVISIGKRAMPLSFSSITISKHLLCIIFKRYLWDVLTGGTVSILWLFVCTRGERWAIRAFKAA